MARRPATEEEKAAVRARIRGAAAGLYAESGLSNITARAVAQRAGVSVGTIYSYFDGLSGLMQSLWQEPVARLEARLVDAAAAEKDPIARIEVLLTTYARFAQDHPDLYRGAFLFVRPRSAPSPESTGVDRNRFAGLLADAIAEAQAQHRVGPGEPLALAQLLWAGIHGALALPNNLDRVSFSEPAALPHGMIRLLVRGLGDLEDE